jgi:hypothetical protein
MQVFDDRFQAESGWNMYSFISEEIWLITESGWLFNKRTVYLLVLIVSKRS